MKQVIPAKRKRSRSTAGYPARRGRREVQKRSLGQALKTAPWNASHPQNSDVPYVVAVKNFDTAIRHFQRRNYDKAKGIFERLAQTAPLGVADRAKVHLRLCEQRLAPPPRPLKTAEDYYVAGVSALSARRLDHAVECLAESARMDPKREEAHYALAAAYALQAQTALAIEHLGISIKLRPQNVVQARIDEDLRSLASDPRFHDLVRPAPAVAARNGA